VTKFCKLSNKEEEARGSFTKNELSTSQYTGSKGTNKQVSTKPVSVTQSELSIFDVPYYFLKTR